MFVIADRVKETTITEGTGDILLNASFGAFATFAQGVGDGNSTYYAIENNTSWEVGIGTYTASTNKLSRDTVLKSSNSDSLIDLSGLSTVFATYAGSRAVSLGVVNMLPDGYPLTLERTSAGNFIHAYVDNSSDETVALHMQDSSSPTWKFGLKNTPNSKTTAPQYGYVYGANGTAGLYGDSDAYAYIDSNLGFYISHEGSNLVQVTRDAGTQIKNGLANVNALTVQGAAAQSYPLQVWKNSGGTTLSSVSKDGYVSINKTSPSYQLDIDGTGNMTTLRFADGTSQITASMPTADFVTLSGVVASNSSSVSTNSSNISTNTTNISTNTSNIASASGALRVDVDAKMPLSSGSSIATISYVDSEVAGLVDSAPAALNTLQELATAINNDAGFATAITTSIAEKMPLSSGDVINTALSNSTGLPTSSGDNILNNYMPIGSGSNIASNYLPIESGQSIIDNYITDALPSSSGENIINGYLPVSSGSNIALGYLPIGSGAHIKDNYLTEAMPTSSGSVINVAMAAAGSGLPHSSGDVINTAIAAAASEAGGLPVSSGQGIIDNYMPLSSGSTIDSSFLPISSGTHISSNYVTSALPESSGAHINGAFILSASGDVINTAISNATVEAISSGLPVGSGDIINTAITASTNTSLPIGSGAHIVSNYLTSALPISSGDTINTAISAASAASLPTASGDTINTAITAATDASLPAGSGAHIITNYLTSAMPVASGDTINTAISASTSASLPFASGAHIVSLSLPISSGDVINTAITAATGGGGGGTYTAGSGLQLDDAGTEFNSLTATTSSAGIITLSNTIDSTQNKALTPKAVNDAGYITSASVLPISSGAHIISNYLTSAMPVSSGDTINTAISASTAEAISSGLPVGSGDTINTAISASTSASLPIGSGAHIISNYITSALPVSSGDTINTAITASTDASLPVGSGATINTAITASTDASLPVGSGAHIISNYLTSALPVSSGATINTAITASTDASLPVGSGATINTAISASTIEAISSGLPVGSGAHIISNYLTSAMPVSSGDTINTAITASTDASLPIGSGATINTAITAATDASLPIGSGAHIISNYSDTDTLYTAGSGLALGGGSSTEFNSLTATTSSAGITTLTNTINSDQDKALTPKAVNDAGYLTSALPVSSGDTINTAISASTSASLPVGSGAHIISNYLTSAMPLSSGATINTAITASTDASLPVGSGAHIISNYLTSVSKSDVGLGNVENTALSTWAGSSNITTLGTISAATTFSTAVKTPAIQYTNGNPSMTITDSGTVTFAKSINQAIANAEAEPEDAVIDIDLRKGNYFEVTLGAAVTDIDFTHGTDGQRFVVRFEQPAGANYAMSASAGWNQVTHDQDGGGSPAVVTIRWAGGTAPTMTATNGKADTYGFIVREENKFDGYVIGQDV